MKTTERLADYFTKNGGLNTVTGSIIPIATQVMASTDPALAAVIVSAFSPETSKLFLGGGVGAVTAGVLIVVRLYMGISRLMADRKAA